MPHAASAMAARALALHRTRARGAVTGGADAVGARPYSPRVLHVEAPDGARTLARVREQVRAAGTAYALQPALVPQRYAAPDSVVTAIGELRAVSPSMAAAWLGGAAAATQWVRLGIHGDGSCLFHSFAAALNVDGYLGASPAARKEIAEHFRCALGAAAATPTMVREVRAETGSPTAQADGGGGDDAPPESGIVALSASMSDATAAGVLAQQLCTPSAWASEPEIRVTARALGVNVVFVDTQTSGSTGAYCPLDHQARGAAAPTVLVVWCNRRKHFEPLLRVAARDARGAVTAVQGALSPARADDAALLRGVHAHFVDTCGPV